MQAALRQKKMHQATLSVSYFHGKECMAVIARLTLEGHTVHPSEYIHAPKS